MDSTFTLTIDWLAFTVLASNPQDVYKRQTRHNTLLSLGVSTRGALALCRAAKALALVRDRAYCLPEDIKELAPTVLSHRVMLSRSQGMRTNTVEHTEQVIQDILETVPVPV